MSESEQEGLSPAEQEGFFSEGSIADQLEADMASLFEVFRMLEAGMEEVAASGSTNVFEVNRDVVALVILASSGKPVPGAEAIQDPIEYVSTLISAYITLAEDGKDEQCACGSRAERGFHGHNHAEGCEVARLELILVEIAAALNRQEI